jgi:hypothetical protein
MALHSIAALRLLNGLLPVISFTIDLTVPRPNLRFPNCWLLPGWGHQPQAQPPTWRTRSSYLYPLETGWPSYSPRHRVPILVAFYDMHGLQWNYFFPGHHTGKSYIYISWRVQIMKLLIIQFSPSSCSTLPPTAPSQHPHTKHRQFVSCSVRERERERLSFEPTQNSR